VEDNLALQPTLLQEVFEGAFQTGWVSTDEMMDCWEGMCLEAIESQDSPEHG
jgi:hypothetical protein